MQLLATQLTIPHPFMHSVEQERLAGECPRKRTREALAGRKPAALLNGRRAPAADTVVVFKELVVFIEEQRSIVAQRTTASGEAVASACIACPVATAHCSTHSMTSCTRPFNRLLTWRCRQCQFLGPHVHMGQHSELREAGIIDRCFPGSDVGARGEFNTLCPLRRRP